ncbi:primosomal protein DnaI [Paenibacillus thalictri]|uniref:Primosomal protein DnaI n=1 Tax=Paenibacillus thalictri TaxID=2527873 RepID=A0A4Q9DK60_9BACL|nr:primosomal protein DnaI [Paenibacillus thalictri]TBL71508.1 primosomal protein DnaI [Paenibacillus thalictri]
MESLGEIMRSMPNSSLMRRAEEKVVQVLADPLVRKLTAKYPGLDAYTLRMNVNKLYQYITEHNQCSQCPGLEKCPNDFTGHYTMIGVEPAGESLELIDYKVSCKKYVAKQAQDAIKGRIRSFYVDDRALKQGYSIDEIVTNDPQRMSAVLQVGSYIMETTEAGLQNKGLFLSGPFGTGKTFLMCYMLYELAKTGLTGAIVYMPDFAEDLKAMFQEPQKLKETIDALKDTDLLVFDDLGAENLNPWLRDHVMGTILNYRMNRKPTFFTSNYSLDDLQKHFSFTNGDGEQEFKGQRIMDRIRPFVDVIEVHGHNKRGM